MEDGLGKERQKVALRRTNRTNNIVQELSEKRPKGRKEHPNAKKVVKKQNKNTVTKDRQPAQRRPQQCP